MYCMRDSKSATRDPSADLTFGLIQIAIYSLIQLYCGYTSYTYIIINYQFIFWQ